MTEEQIHIICKQYKITNYTINSDMSIDVNESVYLWNKGLDKLPLKFNKVSGNFYCQNNTLLTLEGCPKYVDGIFACGYNKLNSINGPIIIKGSYWCNNNQITSLENGPQFVGGNLYCSHNPIYEEFENKFNLDYNLYRKYIKRQKILNQLIND